MTPKKMRETARWAILNRVNWRNKDKVRSEWAFLGKTLYECSEPAHNPTLRERIEEILKHPSPGHSRGWIPESLEMTASAILNLLQEVRRSDREKLREAMVVALPLPTWGVPEITEEMPTNIEDAVDQMRIATVKSALSAFDQTAEKLEIV